MKANDILDLTIDGQGMDGEGVARHDGIVVFVPYTLAGEKVKCKVTIIKKSFAQAKVIKVLTPSQDRISPNCSAYFKCGGCDFLHINPDAHERLKVAELVSNFKKISGENVVLNEYIRSDTMTEYRNKIQLPFGVVKGEVALGYYANKTHEIIPHERCQLHATWADELLKIVLNFVKSHKISAYDERTGKGLMRHLVMRKIGEMLAIVLVINGDTIPHLQHLIDDIAAGGYKFNLHININRQDTNVIMSDKLVTVYGRDSISAKILGIKAEISPLSFMQINDFIRDKIYNKAVELLSGANVAIDLYSGIGITANILAKSCDNVYSIEIVKDAVANAVALSEINGNSKKITHICGDVAEELPKLLAQLRNKTDKKSGDIIAGKEKIASSEATNGAIAIQSQVKTMSEGATESEPGIKYHKDIIGDNNQIDRAIAIQSEQEDVEKNNEITENIIKINDTKDGEKGGFAVLIDPPRKGCDTSTIDAILQALPDKIVYISCNHATLARDFARLKIAYNLTHLSAYDMFPNTHHVETLVCLIRKP